VDAAARARRKELVAALHEVTVASEDLSALLGILSVVTRDAIAQVERGSSAIELAESGDLASRRETLNMAAYRMRRSRHEVQRAFFLLALAEGSSKAEVARVWRVSRQLVSRMVGEHATPAHESHPMTRA